MYPHDVGSRRLLREQAPRARLTVRTTMVDVRAFLRDRGGIAVVPELFKEPDLRAEPLFDEDLVCVLRKGHPLAGRLTVERFAALAHVLVAPLGSSPRGVLGTPHANEEDPRHVWSRALLREAVKKLGLDQRPR